MENKGDAGTQSQEDLEVRITQQFRSGKSRTEVVRDLVRSGMTESEDNPVVERIYFQMKKTAQEEEFSGEESQSGPVMKSGTWLGAWVCCVDWVS